MPLFLCTPPPGRAGHVDAFNDPLIDNKDSKKRYRADVLIEEHVAKIETKIQKEIDKARDRFGESFNEQTSHNQCKGNGISNQGRRCVKSI